MFLDTRRCVRMANQFAAFLCLVAIVVVAHVVVKRDENATRQFCSPSPIAGSSHRHKLHGTKTTYNDARSHIIRRQDVQIPASCRPTMFYLFKRHAIRYPDGEDIPEMDQVLRNIRDEALRAYANGRSGLCAYDIENLRLWKINMKPEDDNLITSTGIRETGEIASRMQSNYPSLLHHRQPMDVVISSRIRTNQTAHAFVRQLFPNKEIPTNFNPAVNLELTEFHALCEEYLKDQGVELGKHPEYSKFQKGEAMRNLLQSVSNRLGLERIMSNSEIKTMFKGCTFGHAIHNDSAWCSVFSKDELRLIELHEDMDDYFADAYGRTINQRSPCPVVRDLVSRIEDLVQQRDLSSRTFLRFSHAGAVKPLISYFGLFDRLNTELSSSSEAGEKWDSRSRNWRSSLISPFSANIQFILYNCTSNGNSGSGIDYRLLTLLQESAVTVRGCDTELCPVDQFLAQYRSAHQCDLEKICRL